MSETISKVLRGIDRLSSVRPAPSQTGKLLDLTSAETPLDLARRICAMVEPDFPLDRNLEIKCLTQVITDVGDLDRVARLVVELHPEHPDPRDCYEALYHRLGLLAGSNGGRG